MPRLDEQILKYIVLRGLLPRTKAFVLQQRAETIPEILAAAKIAETAGIAVHKRAETIWQRSRMKSERVRLKSGNYLLE